MSRAQQRRARLHGGSAGRERPSTHLRRSRRGGTTRVWLIALTAAVALSSVVFSPGPGAEAAVDNLHLSMQVDYEFGQRPNSAVGEASPTLPAPPELGPLGEVAQGEPSGGEFSFTLLCGAAGSECEETPPVVEWEFGDGETETGGLTVTHSYDKPGVYTVRAVASKGSWFGQVLRTVYVAPHWADIIDITTYASVLAADAPMAWWRMNENGLNPTWVDSSGNANNGLYEGDVTYLQESAIVSAAGDHSIHFEGVDGKAEVVGLGLAGNDAFTIEAWVKVDDVPGVGQGMLVLGPTDPDTDGALAWNLTAQGRIRVENPMIGGASLFSAPMTIPMGSWAHVALTYSADGFLRGYVNGQITGQYRLCTQEMVDNEVSPGAGHGACQQVEAFNLDGNLRIGQSRDGTAFFEGSFDELTLYDKELSLTQVRAHYENGSAPRVYESRDDREAIWVTTSLGLFDHCRVATAQKDGASDLEIGRSMFCPEPKVPAFFPNPAPLVPGDSGDPVNGVTGQSCFEAWWVCDLPKAAFAGPNPTAHFSPGASPDTGLLNTLGVYDTGSGQLRYDPTNCGDGWVAREVSPDNWTVEEGLEEGCVSRGQWYDILMRAVDGYIAQDIDLGNTRLAVPLNSETCEDFEDYTAAESLGYRRALKLGVAENVIPDREDNCDLDLAISKREVYLALGNVFGVGLTAQGWDGQHATECGIGTPFRDITDRLLNTPLDGVTGFQNGFDDADCERLTETLSRGAPMVGDMVCQWGEDNEETTCANLDDTFTRGELAVVLGAVLTEEGRGAGGLSLDLSHAGPKPIGATINVTAVGWAPLTTTGELHFTFPGAGEIPASVERLCDGEVSAPTQITGDARRAVAVCGYRFSSETVFPLVVTLEDDFGNFWAQSLVVSSANEPPLVPSTTQTLTVDEGDDGVLLNTFSSVDLGGDTVRLEIARDAMSGWVGQDPSTGVSTWEDAQAYSSAVLADSPLGYWRLDEGAGLVNDATIGDNDGTVGGAPTRGSCGIFLTGVEEDCDNSGYHFAGSDHVDISGVAIDNGAGARTTVEMWVYWEGGDGNLVAFDEQRLRIEDGFLGFGGSESFSVGEGDEEILWETSVLRGADVSELEDSWMYVVAEFGGQLTGSRLYVNGVERNLEPVLGHRTNNNIQSASPEFRIGEGFVGTIDEVAVYDGALAEHRRVYHQELGMRRVLVFDTSTRAVAALNIEALTSSTARVTATPLSGDANGEFNYLIRGCDYEKCSDAAEITGTINPTQDVPLGVSGGVIFHNPTIAVEGGGQFTFQLQGEDPDDMGWVGEGGNPHAGGVTLLRIVDVDWIDPDLWGTEGAPESLEYDSGGGVWVPYTGGMVETSNFGLRYTPGDEPYGDGDLAIHYQVLDTGYPQPPAWSETRTALVRVHSTNTPPLCLAVVDSTPEDTPKEIGFNCVDVDEDELEYEIIDGPGIGSLDGEGDSRTYTPAENWCDESPVAYTYRAFDGSEYSETVSVEVTVTCVNDAPTEPTGAMPTANEDTNAVTNFATTDVDDGPEWTFLVSANGVSGWSASSVNITGGTVSLDQGDLTDKTVEVTFNNTANWCGDYTFYLKANDGEDDSPVRQVDATLTCVNDAPTIPTPTTMPTVNEDTNAVQTFSTTDVDGGPNWTFQVSASAGSGFSSSSVNIDGGTVSVSQGALTNLTASVTFNNSANWCGGYTFYIRVSDGTAFSPVRTVNGTITCVNDAPTTPTINSAWATMVEDQGNITKTYTTTDVDTSGSGSNRWCIQARRGTSGNFTPSTAGCTTGQNNDTNNIDGAWGRFVVIQGSNTNKTGQVRYEPAVNWTGSNTIQVRFCDDGGVCSSVHQASVNVNHFHDTKIVVTGCGANGLFRWYEYPALNTNSSTQSPEWANCHTNFDPILGDWDGNGIDQWGKVQKSNWLAYPHGSHNGNWNGQNMGNPGTAQTRYIGGDWDGDGDDDVGWYVNAGANGGKFYMMDMDTKGVTSWGNPTYPMYVGMSPASGNTDATALSGNGRDEVFLHDTGHSPFGVNGRWQIRQANNGALAVTQWEYKGGCGYTSSPATTMEGCFAMVGDWDGNGSETPGYYDRSSGLVAWKNSFTGGASNGTWQMATGYRMVKGYDKP